MGKNTVSVRITFECGRCSNRVVRVLTSTPDGLLEVPIVYCGRCVRGKNLNQMSQTISEGKIIEPIVVVNGVVPNAAGTTTNAKVPTTETATAK
jgi:hypothetical protein